jgi:hypothetical protein
MGTVTKRILAAAAVLVLAVPGTGGADTTWYGPGNGFAVGPAGGEEGDSQTTQDVETGLIEAYQFQFLGTLENLEGGGLGCAAKGPFAFFDVTHTSAEPVTSVTVTFEEAVVSPYSFMKVSLLQAETFLQTKTVSVGEGTLGDGSFTLELDAPVTGTMIARFGIEVASMCPSVDGGRAIFTGVGFESAPAA